MFAVIETIDGIDITTRFKCRDKATTLRDKIIAKGGEAIMSEVSYD